MVERIMDRHRKLIELLDAGCGDIFDSSNFIENFMILEKYVYYYKLYLSFQSSMFYDFYQNSERKSTGL